MICDRCDDYYSQTLTDDDDSFSLLPSPLSNSRFSFVYFYLIKKISSDFALLPFYYGPHRHWSRSRLSFLTVAAIVTPAANYYT